MLFTVKTWSSWSLHVLYDKTEWCYCTYILQRIFLKEMVLHLKENLSSDDSNEQHAWVLAKNLLLRVHQLSSIVTHSKERIRSRSVFVLRGKALISSSWHHHSCFLPVLHLALLPFWHLVVNASKQQSRFYTKQLATCVVIPLQEHTVVELQVLCAIGLQQQAGGGRLTWTDPKNGGIHSHKTVF